MAALIERSRPWVEKYAASIQRAQFFGRVSMMAWRRDRYQVSDEILAYSQAELQAAEESGDPIETAIARFACGFSHLWRGELDEAEALIQAALSVAERIGDVTFQSQCLAYLTMVYRKRGQVEETRRHLERGLATATAASRLDYINLARAYQAWIAWRDGDLSLARAHGHAVLEGWRQLQTQYMFQWIVLWPLIGAALAQEDLEDATGFARALLEPSQQRMADDVEAAIQAAVQAWDHKDIHTARSWLQKALERAQKAGYL
jgi:tetratricopeptide (TPR) repeat protein